MPIVLLLTLLSAGGITARTFPTIVLTPSDAYKGALLFGAGDVVAQTLEHRGWTPSAGATANTR